MAPGVLSPVASSIPPDGSVRVEKFTAYTAAVCLVAAIGGILFGYDIGVTGGITADRYFLAKFFPEVHCRAYDCTSATVPLPPRPDTDPYCKYDNQLLQLFTSSLYIAGMVASLAASPLTRRFGRRAVIGAAALAFLVGTALSAGAVHVAMVVAGRVLLGVGVGFGNMTIPMYLSEMAPRHMRGVCNLLFQLFTTIGILGAQLINFAVLRPSIPDGWRISLALVGVPALTLLLGCAFLPDTPASLHLRGRPNDALRVLRRSRGADGADVDDEMAEIAAAARTAVKAEARGRGMLLTRRYRPELTMAVLIPFFQQITGINSIMFYSVAILSSVGFGSSAALLNTVIVGAVNVASTLIAIWAVDRYGRRPLFIEAGFQMAAALVVMGGLLAHYFKGGSMEIPRAVGGVVIAVICLFVSAFAWSWGPLGWLVPTEVQPLETRSTGVAISTCVNLTFTFVMGQAFLSMLCGLKWGIFILFAACVAVMTAFVWAFLPETKGVPLEEVADLWKKHWFWKRVVGGGVGEGGGGGGKAAVGGGGGKAAVGGGGGKAAVA